jgi:hypothetical protein
MRRAARVRVLRKAIGGAPSSVLVTSGQTGDGIPELWREIDALILGSDA